MASVISRGPAVYAYTADFTAGLKYFVPEWVAERIAQLL